VVIWRKARRAGNGPALVKRRNAAAGTVLWGGIGMLLRRASTAAIGVLFCLPCLPAAGHLLPLGDGKISTSPRRGYLMSCVRHWRRPPAHGGPWIQGRFWDPSEKPSVQGDVTWPTHRIAITVRGDERIIVANGLPAHATGVFPIARSDPVYRYDRNPNTIRPQRISLELPLNPRPAADPSCIPMGMVGFTTDGAAIYNAVDDGGADAVAHEVQDRCDGHPQHNGQYHYHGPSSCMPNEMTSGLVGYALDGFGIYGMIDRATGRVLHDGDLDACHGTTSTVMWNGRPVRIYHYLLTAEYPYTIGCFRGTPVSADFSRGQLRQMRLGGGVFAEGAGSGRASNRSPTDETTPRPTGMERRRPAGPRQAGRLRRLQRAAGILGVSVQTLRRALGPPPPDLSAVASRLGVPLDALRSALGRPPGGGRE